ncbi:MAG: hypothetical protein GY803_22120 [Chloroflexi bacterium]|nr:hypothetical protein [Chloroflexota bacterium]
MTLKNIKEQLNSKSIFFAEDAINNRPSVIGYHKKFKWSWMATQLNTFIVASDFGDDLITEQEIENSLNAAFQYAKKNYSGWPKGLQSGLGVIVILISDHIDEAAVNYCTELKSGKKWAGFSIPVTINSATNQVYFFDKKPVWGRIYYPYFERMIRDLT